MTEEERRFDDDDPEVVTLSIFYQELHARVGELLEFAEGLKPGGAPSGGDAPGGYDGLLLEAMQHVLGRIAHRDDFRLAYFKHPRIADDIRRFFEQLDRAGLQSHPVYRLAIQVLRHQPRKARPAVPVTMQRTG